MDESSTKTVGLQGRNDIFKRIEQDLSVTGYILFFVEWHLDHNQWIDQKQWHLWCAVGHDS